MNLQTLTNVAGARKKAMRVGRGRGSGKGKTSGRGHKGQYARSGHKHKPGFEGGQMKLIRRMPKRGFRSDAEAYVAVNVGSLDRFGDGEAVTVEALRVAGLVRGRGRVKILATGELQRRLSVKAQAFSAGARAKIEVVGGTCEIVPAT